MKILILDTYYPAFLCRHATANPNLTDRSYADQWRALQDACFGTSDFYSVNLKSLGHNAHEVVTNSDPLQLQWAREHAPHLARQHAPVGRANKAWQLAVVQAQIDWFQPDVLYVQDMTWTPDWLLRSARTRGRLVVGQTAYVLSRWQNLRDYDLIVTSFPHYVRRFRERGIASAYVRLAFDPRVLGRVPHRISLCDTAFVGSYSTDHRQGIQLLEAVARRTPVDFWGIGADRLPAGSPIRQRYHGEAWGLEMFAVLAGARVALNRHIGVAENFANNMRLYEATGVGTCLVTDRKDNLGDLFELDREVVAYDSAEDCAEKVRYLLSHEAERAKIAAAGQARTLREHTYACRMQELATMLESHLRQLPTAARRSFSFPSIRQMFATARGQVAISQGHRPIDAREASTLVSGWQSEHIPAQQRRLVAGELQRMYWGRPVQVFRVAAAAVRATGVTHPLIIELGCASAYYSEVLPHLLGRPIRYIGVDYSVALLRQAREHYGQLPVARADATALPLADSCCDIVFSSALLMHVPDYRRAIDESARLAGPWCIFHRTPLLRRTATTTLSKEAYGVPVVELAFNEGEIRALFDAAGLDLVKEYALDGYTVPELGERVTMKTFVCRKRRG